MKSATPSGPLVWMNVTTSANWNRPPVGIVRVEEALCAELARIYGSRFRRCVWMDGTFVEWTGSSVRPNKQLDEALDVLLPNVPTFDLARRVLAGRLTQLNPGRKSSREGLNALLSSDISLAGHERIKPGEGDILISVGLDWDQPYSTELFRYAKYTGLKIITCCYDLIPVLFPQYCVGDVASKFKSYFDLLNWSSSAVLCISQQSQKDLLDLWEQTGANPRPTKVIPLGDNVPSGKGSISSEVKTITSSPFILFVSTIERRKNHEVLYKAYHLLCRAGLRDKLPKLVFVGMPGWGVGDLLKDIELDPLTQGLVVQLNHVNDAELLELYKKARFCVYPSLYEGWGLPVGEALSLGKVVLSSDQGSLPEVGGNLVRYVQAWNPQAWADAIYELATDEEELRRLADNVEKNYVSRKWRDTAQVVAEVVDSLANEPVREIELYPGYDFSTQSGIHVGHKLRATGHAGFLMHGPFLGLQAGQYSVEVKILQPEGSRTRKIHFDVVSENGKTVLEKYTLPAQKHDAPSDGAAITVSLSLNLSRYYNDIEIRCQIEEGESFDIESVEVRRETH
jgi:glycosyltransferase involved in cell wall biosynthesis